MRFLFFVIAAVFGLVPARAFAQAGPAPTVLPIPPPAPVEAPPQTPAIDPPPDLSGLVNRPVTRVAIVLEGNVWDDVQVPPVTSLKPGEPLTASKMRAALRELLHTGLFARGRIWVQQDGEGALVTARMVPRKLVDRLQVDVHGARVDIDDLLRSADLESGGEIVGADMEATIGKLERHFALHGYPSAKARIQMRDTDDPMRALVIVDVAPGAPRLIGDRQFYVFGAPEGEVLPIARSYSVGKGDRVDEPMFVQADAALGLALRAKGWFSATVSHDLVWVVGPAGGGQVTLRVRIDTGPRLVASFDGNEHYDADVLTAALGLDTETDRSPLHLADKIRTFYEKRGFLDVEVRATLRDPDDPRVRRVVFEIAEHQRVAVMARRYPCLKLDAIKGLSSGPSSPGAIGTEIDSFLEEELPGADLLANPDPRDLDALLAPGGAHDVASAPAVSPVDLKPDATYVADVYDRAVEHVQELYRNEGFLHAEVGPIGILRARCDPHGPPGRCAPLPLPKLPTEVCEYDAAGLPASSPSIDPSFTCRPDPAHGIECAPTMELVIPVKLGPRTQLWDVSFTGVKAMSESEVAAAAKVPLGEPVSSLKLDDARRRIIDWYKERGYYYVDVKSALEPSADNTRSRVRFDVTEGDQVVVRAIVLRGLENTREGVVRRRIALQVGQPYRASDVRRTQERLATLGVFSGITVSLSDPYVPQAYKDVEITLVERPAHYLEPSVGFSTGEGARGALEFDVRNIFGYGIGASFRAQLSYLPDFLIIDPQVKANYADVQDRLARRIILSGLFPDVGLGPLVRAQADAIYVRDLERDFTLDKLSFTPSLIYRPESRGAGHGRRQHRGQRRAALPVLLGGGVHRVQRDEHDERGGERVQLGARVAPPGAGRREHRAGRARVGRVGPARQRVQRAPRDVRLPRRRARRLVPAGQPGGGRHEQPHRRAVPQHRERHERAAGAAGQGALRPPHADVRGLHPALQGRVAGGRGAPRRERQDRGVRVLDPGHADQPQPVVLHVPRPPLLHGRLRLDAGLAAGHVHAAGRRGSHRAEAGPLHQLEQQLLDRGPRRQPDDQPAPRAAVPDTPADRRVDLRRLRQPVRRPGVLLRAPHLDARRRGRRRARGHARRAARVRLRHQRDAPPLRGLRRVPLRHRALLMRRALALWRTPLGKVLVAAALLRLTGLAWGLPASDGWDDDGVAPRDFLVGVLETYWPGHHYTYPPLHLLLLTVTSAPVWIVSLLRAPSLDAAALVHSFIAVPTMTALAVIARLVTLGLSLGLLWNLAEIGKRLGGSARAGTWVAVACGLDAVLTYYSQTTNLDVPYLFWSFVALRWLVHAIVKRAPRGLRRAVVYAALAVATKDQAYGLFVFGLPLSLAAWLALDRSARPREVLREVAIGAGIALPLLLLVDGAITNPAGWLGRVHYLLGSASQDFAFYPPTLAGRLHAARDALASYRQFYPWPFALLGLAGLVVACRAPGRARRAAGLVPLFAALSFTIAFDMSARRSEHRFALPQMVVLGLYAGLALDAVHARLRRDALGVAAGLGVAALLAFALFGCVAVDAAMVLDPRYDAEAWMRDHVRPGNRLEIYGTNVQLPRLPEGAEMERVDLGPVATRNPILGVTEVQAPFGDIEARRPKYILASEFWVGRYLLDPGWSEPNGRVFSKGQERLASDADSRAYFHALRDGRLPYRMAHVSTWTSSFWPRVDIHASLTRELSIFERVP